MSTRRPAKTTNKAKLSQRGAKRRFVSLTADRFVTKYFKALERSLAARAAVPGSAHRGDQGEDRERLVVNFLNDHLPKIATAHRGGAVLDSRDVLSAQTDVVVYSNWSPLLQQQGKPIFLAEGTFAAIKVKSLLTAQNLKQALQAATHIKNLLKFHMGLEMHGVFPASQTAHTICTGIFAFNSLVKPDAIRKLLFDHHKSGVANTAMIDFVCVNAAYCIYRHRTEDIHSFFTIGSGGRTRQSTSERKKECIYATSLNPLASTLDVLLDYISYIGPLRKSLLPYLHATTFYDRPNPSAPRE